MSFDQHFRGFPFVARHGREQDELVEVEVARLFILNQVDGRRSRVGAQAVAQYDGALLPFSLPYKPSCVHSSTRSRWRSFPCVVTLSQPHRKPSCTDCDGRVGFLPEACRPFRMPLLDGGALALIAESVARQKLGAPFARSFSSSADSVVSAGGERKMSISSFASSLASAAAKSKLREPKLFSRPPAANTSSSSDPSDCSSTRI